MRKKGLIYLVCLVIILAIWQICSLIVNKDFLPGSISSMTALGTLLVEGEVTAHIVSSAYRILLGTLIGVIFALPLGLLLGCSEKIDEYLGNIFNVLYPIPKVVFLPIIIVTLGIGDAPKIFLIALVVFFQLTLSIRDSVRHMPNDAVISMKTMRPNKIQYLTHLVIPACIPELLTGIRGTIGVSTALLFITENFASVTGLGYFITRNMDIRNFDEMYAGIILLALLGVIFYVLIWYLELKICKWKYVDVRER